ncbi:conserved Plasmodium protein, unknown function [Plasmodium sp. gorilla clade G2]|uniref:conserved Plasmodium protein, unknown function n=1 Tax=Plasmodium sp. gorilla clade G2 TaxID=880535 RepID=UPI000D21607B|nr:conserved Plasmodium protein, unknown function [Plasmodium sp. gorilla clade G2]SOV11481.1 conserved Plasmodium protein, unknown function [Plasmodium sp. gorilla clade G2]
MNCVFFLCFYIFLSSVVHLKVPVENAPFVFNKKENDIKYFLDKETPDDLLLNNSYSLDITLENFPNPFFHPSLCNRYGLRFSYICDPNKILSRNIADQIEEILNYQRRNSKHYCVDKEVPYILGVALINKLPYGISADTFASQIFEYWKLSNKDCNDGVLLFFVKEDTHFILKWKKGAQSIINFRTATSMNKSFNQYIRKYSLEYSILSAVKLTSQYLTEEIIPPTQTAQKVVAFTIVIVVGLAYLAFILIVFADAQMDNK